MTQRQYRLIGFLRSNSGLAIAAQNTLHALRASGREVREITVEPNASADPHGSDLTGESGDAVNLFHLNPFEIAAHSSLWQASAGGAAYNVCVPFWELPLVPKDWEPILSAMDFVLAPTHFVANACKEVVGAQRVIHYPQAVFPSAGAKADRSRWGLGDAETVFIASFDITSGIDRKNPWAAIDAFQRAFPQDAAVRLVLKTRMQHESPEYEADARRLAARAADDERIMLLGGALSYADVLSLYASCDVMVSLHRSEGLGLHLMEAMSCGVVVVATGWSGNMDFMTEDNSVRIPYELVPVRTEHTAYVPEVRRAGQVWAEADIQAASDQIRRLHLNPELRASMGERAAADMEERRQSQLSGAAFDELEGALGAPRQHGADLDSAIAKTVFAMRKRRLHHRWLELRRRLRPGR